MEGLYLQLQALSVSVAAPENKALIRGGAIDANQTTLIFEETLGNCFIENSAGHDGGAIASESGIIEISGSNSTFTSNYAGNGGAMYLFSSKLYGISGQAVFTLNRASYGGAIHLVESLVCAISADESSFAQTCSGHIALTTTKQLFFIDNTAQYTQF